MKLLRSSFYDVFLIIIGKSEFYNTSIEITLFLH